MKFLNFAVCIFLAIFVIGCSSMHTDNRTINDLVNHFKSSGLNVGQISPKTAEMIGASEGVGIEISGNEVEAYRYDISNESQKLTLSKIAKEGTVTVFSIVIPATVNGSFVLLSYHTHPEKEKILKAFNSWGFDKESSAPSANKPASDANANKSSSADKPAERVSACSEEATLSTIRELINQSIDEDVTTWGGDEGLSRQASVSSAMQEKSKVIKDLISKSSYEISAITTVADGGATGQTLCKAILQSKLSGDFAKVANMPSIRQMITDDDVAHSAQVASNSLKTSIDYNVHPTDDKKQIVVEMDGHKAFTKTLFYLGFATVLDQQKQAQENPASP